MIALPQQFQYLNHVTPFDAGVHLLPFNALISLGGILSSSLAAKLRVQTFYLFCLAAVFQIAGLGAAAFIPVNQGNRVPATVYGVNVVIGSTLR